MRSEADIRAEFDRILTQIRSLEVDEIGSAADKYLQSCARVLLWVLEDTRAKKLALEQNLFDWFKVVG